MLSLKGWEPGARWFRSSWYLGRIYRFRFNWSLSRQIRTASDILAGFRDRMTETTVD